MLVHSARSTFSEYPSPERPTAVTELVCPAFASARFLATFQVTFLQAPTAVTSAKYHSVASVSHRTCS